MDTFASTMLVPLITFCCVLFRQSSAQGVGQETLDYMAWSLRVKYEVLDNFRDSLKTFSCQITLTNAGTRLIPGSGWAIYFNQMNLLEPNHYPYPEGVVLPDQGVRFRHIKGSIFSLEPDKGFSDLPAGGTRTIRYLSENFSVSRTDAFPNWYLVAPGLEPRTIVNTAGEGLDWVGTFDTENKWKRYDYKIPGAEGHDRYDPYTPAVRFALNDVQDLGGPGKLVIPTPAEMTVSRELVLQLNTKDWAIHAPQMFAREAEMLGKRLGVSVVSRKPKRHVIVFKASEVKVHAEKTQLSGPEAYSLTVDPEADVVEIQAKDPRGAFYGAMTLINLMGEDFKVPKASIVDAPRYEYRGLMLDVARNFHPVDDVVRLLDLMAQYKLNKLHLHLTDDEGWRLQIPGLEELTQVAGRRCHDLTERECLLPFYGSGPMPDGRGSGFYTADDYRKILHEAAQRHIQVIPEVDMPGHGHAAIKAMESRKQRLLAANNKTEANRFVLADEEDPSRYKSIQLFTDNAVNPCLASTYNFVAAVIHALVELHRDVMPLQIYHFGGDEVAKGAWENSSACDTLMTSGFDFRQFTGVKEFFVRQVSNLTDQYGLSLAAWEDGVMESGSTPYKRSELLNREVLAYAWDNVWEWGVANRAYKLANAGYKVVMAQATHLYFDHPYEPDPEERGLYWAPRFTDTRKVFLFTPSDLYANADVTRAGERVSHKELCGKDGRSCVELQKPENIVGIQGHLWSEIIRTRDQADYMLFPRVLALAERAWHQASWENIAGNSSQGEDLRRKDWVEFANTLGYRELARLGKQGVTYRVPPPGAKMVNGQLAVNVLYPGLTVQYSKDSGMTWCTAFTNATFWPQQPLLLRTRSADGSRHSRIVRINLASIGAANNVACLRTSVYLQAFLIIISFATSGYVSRSLMRD